MRWYLAFPISYRDLASMLSDRGVEVDHTTLFCWVQVYAPTLERRIRRHLHSCNGSWRVDETYIKVRGVWTYLYRAVDSLGQTTDFLLSARRDASAARCFFRKALRQPHVVNLRTLTVDKNAAYLSAVKRLKRAGQLWRFSRLRQCKYRNNIVEQDRQAHASTDPHAGPIRQRDLHPGVLGQGRRILGPARRWQRQGQIGRDLNRHEHRHRVQRQFTAPNLLAPVPQQSAADLVSPSNGRQRGARLLGLCHDPEFLLQPPAASAFNPGDDLHPARP